jgi:CRP-like cAMP-binding protein
LLPGGPAVKASTLIASGSVTLRAMQRAHFDALLLRTPLLAGMDLDSRDRLVSHFVPHPFAKGEPILRAGDPGRHLAIVLDGQAVVHARKDDQAYKVDLLGVGEVFGEIAFFDAESQRTADVIGETDGLVALLPWSAYESLARVGDPAGEVLEKAVLDLLSRRIQRINDTLGEMLEATRDGSWLAALRRFIGVRSS